MNQNAQNQQYQENEFIDIKELIIRCFCKWYWLVISIVFFAALAVLYAFSTTFKYDVKAVVSVHEEAAAPSYLGTIGTMLNFAGLGGSNAVSDELELINSRTFMEEVVRILDIQTEYRKKDNLRWKGQYPEANYSYKVIYPPLFCDTTMFRTEMELKRKENGYKLKVKHQEHTERYFIEDITQPFETFIGELCFIEIKGMEVGDKLRITTPSMLGIVDEYRKSISAKQLNKESNMLSISTRTDMPRRAIDIINLLIRLYDEDAIKVKNTQATQMLAFVNNRLESVALELDSVEVIAEQYMRENQLSADVTTEAALVLQSATQYKHKLVELETQINLVDYISQFVTKRENHYTAIPANLGITDNGLVTLIGQYNALLLDYNRIQHTATENNPILAQLEERLTAMRQNIVMSIKSVREGLVIMRDDALVQDKMLSDQIARAPEKERGYLQIKRDQTIKQTVYLYLYQKREETLLALSSNLNPAKVIDVPKRSARPVAPRRMIILAAAMLFGCLLPIGVIGLLMILSTKIVNAKDYVAKIKLPVVGYLTHHSSNTYLIANDVKYSREAEQFRLLRANMLHKATDKARSTILVTSAVDGEGKTYTAVNTAYTLAMMHKKTVVIGLDFRTPALAQVFGTRTGCLADYLTGDKYAVEDIIYASKVNPYLDIIPAGEVGGNDIDAILQCSKLRELIQTLQKQYDYVVIDSAPVVTVSDTLLITDLASLTLFVSRLNYINDEEAAYINQLAAEQRLPNMLGVINDLPSQKNIVERILA